jgi:hypothetical protein
MIRVWFSAQGASQTPPRPWFVDFGDGRKPAEVQDVTLASGSSYTLFADEGFKDIPNGPRAVMVMLGEVRVTP